MANFILLIAILLAAVSFTSFTARDASDASDGPNWAVNMCSSAHQLCQYPQQITYAAVGLAALWLVLKFVSAIRH
jgi:hypothetical protein